MATQYIEALLKNVEVRGRRVVQPKAEGAKPVEVISAIVPGQFEALIDLKNPNGLMLDQGDTADIKVNIGSYNGQLTFKLLEAQLV